MRVRGSTSSPGARLEDVASTRHARSVRRQVNHVGVEGRFAVDVIDAGSGLSVRFFGSDRQTLDHLAEDVARAHVLPLQDITVVRDYGRGGTGARDLRSGATVTRFKDAMHGKLEPLLQAYRLLRERDVLKGSTAGEV